MESIAGRSFSSTGPASQSPPLHSAKSPTGHWSIARTSGLTSISSNRFRQAKVLAEPPFVASSSKARGGTREGLQCCEDHDPGR